MRAFSYIQMVTEALNPEKELFGDDRLLHSLNANLKVVGDVEQFVAGMYDAVDAFAGEEEQADDITMVYLIRV